LAFSYGGTRRYNDRLQLLWLLTVLQAPKLVLPSGISVAQDPSGFLGIFSASGTQVETIDGAGHHVFANTNSSTSHSNFEIVTNGTTNTLTGTSLYIANYPAVAFDFFFTQHDP